MTDETVVQKPYVRIIEQPARSAVRFRYECEGRSAGPIPGANSSTSCPTYPTIQVMNYPGRRAMVVVSCVTQAQSYRQHPHHLVGRVGCHNGICTMIIDNCDHLCTFTHLGIQCAKRNEIASRLKLRQQMKIDPTGGGFDHINNSVKTVDLGSVRLCFEVYLEGPKPDQFCIPLEPVVSDPIYDKKLLSKLSITDISQNNTIVSGGKIMIFCNYIDEDDIEVVFYELDPNGHIIWQDVANTRPPYGEVHKRAGMAFMAPPYRDLSVTRVVKCYMQLRRISDQETSDPIVFYYLPINLNHQCSLMSMYDTPTPLHVPGYTKRSRTKRNYNSVDTYSSSAAEGSPDMKSSANGFKFEGVESDESRHSNGHSADHSNGHSNCDHSVDSNHTSCLVHSSSDSSDRPTVKSELPEGHEVNDCREMANEFRSNNWMNRQEIRDIRDANNKSNSFKKFRNLTENDKSDNDNENKSYQDQTA